MKTLAELRAMPSGTVFQTSLGRCRLLHGPDPVRLVEPGEVALTLPDGTVLTEPDIAAILETPGIVQEIVFVKRIQEKLLRLDEAIRRCADDLVFEIGCDISDAVENRYLTLIKENAV